MPFLRCFRAFYMHFMGTLLNIKIVLKEDNYPKNSRLRKEQI